VDRFVWRIIRDCHQRQPPDLAKLLGADPLRRTVFGGNLAACDLFVVRTGQLAEGQDHRLVPSDWHRDEGLQAEPRQLGQSRYRIDGIVGMPLFSGFIYAAIGRYVARVIRIFDMQFAPYPPFWQTLVLAGAIYLNFFTHHFGPDIRVILFTATVGVFWRTRIWFHPGETPRWMPLPVAAFL
jgi:hypothetical protein